MCSLEYLKDKLAEQQAIIGVITAGYIGLPLLAAFAEKGFLVLGFDVDQYKVSKKLVKLTSASHTSATFIQQS